MSLEKQKRVERSIARISSRRIQDTGAPGVLFISDRKGDPQNLTYASLDKYKIPRYRTTGYGRLLGLDRRFRVVSSSDTRRDVHDEGNDTTRKGRNAPSLTNSDITEDTLFIGQSANIEDDASINEQRDFIGLDSRRIRKRRKLSAPEDEQPMIIYEGSDGERLKSEESSISDTDQGVGADRVNDAFEQFRNHPDNMKQIDLTRMTDIEPADAGAWLALIDHQERYFLLSEPNGTKILSASARRTVAEIKLSLYERALTKVTISAERRKLLLGYLQEGSKIWDTKTQLKQWKVSLKQNQSIDLWYKYLDFQQSNSIIFSYEQCLEVYLEILGKIRELDDDEGLGLHICYWTSRLTTFMFQAGFAERAIAIWQGMLEINFLTPPSMSEERIMSTFELFWDHETARVGEPGARGWCTNGNTNPESITDAEPIRLDESAIFSSWLQQEAARSREYMMPARTLDDTLEDDPYRVIIFSDIKEFLNFVRTKSGRQNLLLAFLKFCGLPPLSCGSNEHDSWWGDPFLCGHQLRPVAEDSFVNGLASGDSFSQFSIDTSTLFPQQSWFSAWSGVEPATSMLLNFASKTMAQLVDSRPEDDNLAAYNIAFKFHLEPTSARKYAKSLLKKRSESLLLYNAYALLEARGGNSQAAVKVWLTALSMARSLSADVQKQSVFLWHDLIQELVCRKEFHQAINALLALTTNGKIDIDTVKDIAPTTHHTPSEYLKADRFYRDRITDTILSHEWLAVSAYTDLRSTYQYLTNDYSLFKALAVFNTTITSVREDANANSILESLHQSRAKLIHLHATLSLSGYKPSQLLPPLKESHFLFPNNTIFHTLHEHYSRRAGLIDRLRDLNPSTSPLNPTTSPKSNAETEQERIRGQRKSIIPSLLKISLEISRPSYAGTTNHSIRSAFKKATSPDDKDTEGSARHNPSTWISWLEWELSLLPSPPPPSSSSTSLPSPTPQSSASTKRIKDLYHTSLRLCPWSKDLYLLGFKGDIMRQIVGTEGLKEIYLSMRERGIRVRIDIGDLLDEGRMED